jgi:hypothetical protein
LGALALAGAAQDQGPQPRPDPPESVERLIEQLGSQRSRVREEATRKLMGRPDALPALKKALRSPDAEVRRRAREIIDEIENGPKRRKLDRLLARVKDGEADLLVEQMIVLHDLSDAAWPALMDLAKAVIDKANKEPGKRIPFPNVDGEFWRKRGRLWKFNEVEEVGIINDFRTLAHRISNSSIIGRSILVCQGQVRCSGNISDCIVFTNGDVGAFDRVYKTNITSSVVICDGSIEAGEVWNSVLIATGPIKVKDEIHNSVLIENAREALKLVKFYDTRQAGVEVGETKGRGW